MLGKKNTGSKSAKEFDAVEKAVKQSHNTHQVTEECPKKCKYCNTLHKPRRNPVYSINCNRCGRSNHFECMYRSMNRRVTRDVGGEKNGEVHDPCQDAESTEVLTEEFDAVRSKVFNLHTV